MLVTPDPERNPTLSVELEPYSPEPLIRSPHSMRSRPPAYSVTRTELGGGAFVPNSRHPSLTVGTLRRSDLDSLSLIAGGLGIAQAHRLLFDDGSTTYKATSSRVTRLRAELDVENASGLAGQGFRSGMLDIIRVALPVEEVTPEDLAVLNAASYDLSPRETAIALPVSGEDEVLDAYERILGAWNVPNIPAAITTGMLASKLSLESE
jgi:hypothetical protein